MSHEYFFASFLFTLFYIYMDNLGNVYPFTLYTLSKFYIEYTVHILNILMHIPMKY